MLVDSSEGRIIDCGYGSGGVGVVGGIIGGGYH